MEVAGYTWYEMGSRIAAMREEGPYKRRKKDGEQITPILFDKATKSYVILYLPKLYIYIVCVCVY